LAVWRKAASYRPERGDVPGWLYTITRNRVVDRWRRKGGLVEDDDFDLLALAAPERGDDGHAVDLSVRQALAALTAEQREAIELAYFGGLTYEETASRLALPLGTLKSRIRAGLARMRAVLAPAETA
ncbi:MAG: sigma-70 family RNA polymerase sigma factor, partial [Thermoanaerobaculia bacterium]|nr:sigma-70 family RNA polymerase sigma factor [Thermoanaerobaculia bacterium]